MAAEIEKACPVNSKNRSSYSHFYEQLGMNALTQDDCTSAMAWLTKAIDHGYSVNDITTWLSRSPWCSATALQASAEWFVVTETQKGSLESDARDLEFESLSARLADTGNRLVISGSRGAGELRQTVNLTLAKGPAGWSCAFVDWSKRGSSVRGTCEATLTTLSAGKGGFDEGTFSATFTSAEKGQLESWTQGRFHVRRE